MEYPGNFDTPAFPAGRRIALSRAMAIAFSLAVVVIAFLCGLLIWSAKSMRVDPFLISIDKTTGTWSIVGHEHNNMYSAARTLQESVVGRFTEKWLAINQDMAVNDAMWMPCARDACSADNKNVSDIYKCGIYCATSDELFTRFSRNIVPKYQERAMAGEYWVVDMAGVEIVPLGPVTTNGGAWRVTVDVESNKQSAMSIMAFVLVSRDAATFPQSLGFYVSDFNAYRIK